MTSIPKIEGPARNKPLSYDPMRDRFILYDDILSGKEKVVPVETLSYEQQKKLVLERNRAAPEYTIGTITGGIYPKKELIEAIESDTELGRTTIKAEIAYLSELLKQIQEALKKG
jgi:hypothetical protein